MILGYMYDYETISSQLPTKKVYLKEIDFFLVGEIYLALIQFNFQRSLFAEIYCKHFIFV